MDRGRVKGGDLSSAMSIFWILYLTIKSALSSLRDMNAATIAKQFEIASQPVRSCGRDLCFACCAGTCPDARPVEPTPPPAPFLSEEERADLEAHAPALPAWSEADFEAFDRWLDSQITEAETAIGRSFRRAA